MNNSRRTTSALGEQNTNIYSFDWLDAWRVIKKKFFPLLLVILICAFGFSFFKSITQPDKYRSSATIFLTPKFTQDGNLDQQSIKTNQTLLNNAIALVTRENIMVQTAEEIGNMSPDEIRETLNVSAEEGTELITISSTTSDPQLSKKIVDATVSAFILTMKENLNLNNITIVDQPKLDFESVSPSPMLYLLEGAAAGVLIDAAIIAATLFLDKRLRTREETEEFLGLPVFVVLPDMD